MHWFGRTTCVIYHPVLLRIFEKRYGYGYGVPYSIFKMCLQGGYRRSHTYTSWCQFKASSGTHRRPTGINKYNWWRVILYHFDWFGRGCDMGQGGQISGAGQWLCNIGWLKISAKFNIRPGPFYSSKRAFWGAGKNFGSATCGCDWGQMFNFGHIHSACDMWRLNHSKWYSTPFTAGRGLFCGMQNCLRLYCKTIKFCT